MADNRRNRSKKKDRIAVNWTTSGRQQVILTGTNQHGCDTTIRKNVEVLEAPDPVVKGPDSVCSKADATYRLKAQQAADFQWSTENGQLLSDPSAAKADVKWANAGDSGSLMTEGLVQAEVEAANGCKAEANQLVTVQAIEAQVTPSSLTTCAPERALFSAGESRNATAFNWQFEGGQATRGQTVLREFENPGYYQVQLVATNPANCTDTAIATINISRQPQAAFTFREPDTPSQYILNQDRLAINNQSKAAHTYQWNFGDGHASSQADPEHVYQDTGAYRVKLIARGRNGCQDSLSKLVDVRAKPYLFVPTAFSPNGDGLNDHFRVEATNIADFTVKIYDRWGEELFVSHDPDFQWDGTYKGEQVPLDTYLYVITGRGYEGQFVKRSGKVTVVQ